MLLLDMPPCSGGTHSLVYTVYPIPYSAPPSPPTMTQVAAVLLPDTAPPTLTLLPGGYPSQLFVNSEGGTGLITNITVGMPYQDPGGWAYGAKLGGAVLGPRWGLWPGRSADALQGM
jgi:hypothetical protein